MRLRCPPLGGPTGQCPHGLTGWALCGPRMDGPRARSPAPPRSGEHGAGNTDPPIARPLSPDVTTVPTLPGSAATGSSLELAPRTRGCPHARLRPLDHIPTDSWTDPGWGAAAPCNQGMGTGCWSPRPWPVGTCSRPATRAALRDSLLRLGGPQGARSRWTPAACARADNLGAPSYSQT